MLSANRTTSSTCSSSVMWVVSISIESAAWRNGLSMRVVSISSRCTMLLMTSSRSTIRSFSSNSLCLRKALTSKSAVMKSFNSAFGNTTVPMSRPSITTAFSLPIFLCCSTIAVRTSLIALTSLTRPDTLMLRIGFSTLSPLRKVSVIFFEFTLKDILIC